MALSSSTITFSSTGALATGGVAAETVRPMRSQVCIDVTVVNGEVVTINHGEDEFNMRDVRVATLSTGVDYAGAAVARTNTKRTTITFTAAGTYRILIEW